MASEHIKLRERMARVIFDADCHFPYKPWMQVCAKDNAGVEIRRAYAEADAAIAEFQAEREEQRLDHHWWLSFEAELINAAEEEGVARAEFVLGGKTSELEAKWNKAKARLAKARKAHEEFVFGKAVIEAAGFEVRE
jgi:hypothetical protein